MSKRIDPTPFLGERFGKWTVIDFAGWKNQKATFICRCDCGNEREIPHNSLIRGLTKSCGRCEQPWIEAEEDHYRYHCVGGDSFVFSPCDLKLAQTGRWCVSTNGYAVRDDFGSDGQHFAREALRAKADEYVDHISMETRDERRENLRICSWSENNCNKTLQSNNTSGFKGVSFNKASGKFMASLWKDGKHFYGGIYESKEAAARAYDALARVHHGEFARLNFPLPGERGCRATA
mgnify:CR=1 FL=1